MNEVMVVNPRRRRRRRHTRRARAAHNPVRRRRRRRYFRNPGLPSLGGLPLQSIGIGVAGAIGAELGGAAVAKFLPANMQGAGTKLAVKAGLVVAAAILGRRFLGSSVARSLAIGGGIAVGVEAFRTFVMPSLPGLQDLMSDYVQPEGIGEYLSGVGRTIQSSEGSIFGPLVPVVS